ncbi:unnamed protein product [Adineta steineri]|uniref:Uncharacterized protein n=1 Tax=Adineta steineri TaxID=433720 RepID=A0A814H3D9_9BILA|nr:unnamed protein product [Adineta steineri]
MNASSDFTGQIIALFGHNGIDKEQMTSTSVMSTTSSDEQANNSPAKHVYEELTDESTMLRRNNKNDACL